MTQKICNKCGKKLNLWDIQQKFFIYTVAQYGSKYDGDEIELDLCCDCMDELIKSCKISPIEFK